MIDLSKLQLSSDVSSNKILKEGSGTFNVPALATAGEVFAVATISHNFGSDNLLFQVSTSSRVINRAMLPWAPGNNRQIQYSAIDATNLYIYFISTDSGGFGEPAITVNYSFRILIP
jgi:hypothetical protein